MQTGKDQHLGSALWPQPPLPTSSPTLQECTNAPSAVCSHLSSFIEITHNPPSFVLPSVKTSIFKAMPLSATHTTNQQTKITTQRTTYHTTERTHVPGRPCLSVSITPSQPDILPLPPYPHLLSGRQTAFHLEPSQTPTLSEELRQY